MIRVESLKYQYEDGTQALTNINLDLERGNIVGLVGANGSGKSTSLSIMGILKPTSGQIIYKGNQ